MSNISPGQDLDLSLLFEIADGSDEFIVESIEMFLQQTPEILQSISASIEEKNWPAVASAAHKIKANLGFFGMPVCKEIIQEIEHGAKHGAPDPEILISKFKEVQDLIKGNLISLEKIKNEKAAGL